MPGTQEAAAERPRVGRPSLFTLLMFTVIAVFVFMLFAYGISPTFNLVLINPLINALVALDRIVGGQFGLAIILFTLLLRVATLPFTIRQFQSVKNMQAAQPVIQEIQKKHKDPKRRQEEIMRVYREYGINPLGCFMPMFIQMVVFIALYQALRHTVGGTPESLISLSQRLYPIRFLHETVPLDQHFLWLDLGRPDSTFILPLLVAYATFVQQRLSITPNATPQQQQQQQMMQWMLPLMLAWITLTLPSGVGVYWVVTNMFSVFTSYYVYGRRGFSWRHVLLPLPVPATAPAPAARPRSSQDGRGRQPAAGEHIADESGGTPDGREPAPSGASDKARSRHGKRRGKRKNRR
jgi:YidC/Oxa1 family membrane protein insertase